MAETTIHSSADMTVTDPAGAPSNSNRPAHPAHHKRHKKGGSDPFFELSDDAVKSTDLSAPIKNHENTESKPDSLLADLLLTPLSMITFLLSLTMVDYRQRQWRLSQHASAPEGFWYRVTHWSWLHPEPYQDSSDSTWKHNDKTPLQNAPDSDFQGWYTQKKHRAIAKLEISDAFEVRGRVIVAVVAWGVIGIAALTYAARRMYRWLLGV